MGETLKDLAFKLGRLDREIDKLIMEYNKTCDEIVHRLPELAGDPNLKPKKRERKYGDYKIGD